ncbi:hypothetical protein GGI12_000335 [Dipsacomyces acuminosporus]|nr:hypothetical protein GGI12_000335 [Dipsacomyces acuminosporus]
MPEIKPVGQSIAASRGAFKWKPEMQFLDLTKTFNSICTVPRSVGAVILREEDGAVVKTSGTLGDDIDEAVALSNLMKDAAKLASIVRPETQSLTRVTISRNGGESVVATPHLGHIVGVKLANR